MLKEAPIIACESVIERWQQLGPLTKKTLMKNAPWATKEIDWGSVEMNHWNSKFGNVCHGSVLKNKLKTPHGVLRMIKPNAGLVEA